MANSGDSSVIGPRRDYPLDSPLCDIFDARAQATPGSIALVALHGDGSTREVSYAALAALVEQARGRLATLGIVPGRAVAVYLDRSPEAVAALLAVWRMGAAYVPLDAILPPRLVSAALAESHAQAVITSSAHARAIDGCDAAIVRVDGETDSGRPVEPLDALQDIAIVMYTSGTTGQPKGVLHRERQVRNRLHWMWEDYPFEAGEVMCQRSPLGVMPSMWELLGGLLRGLPTVIVPDSIVKDAGRLAATISEHGLSRVTVTPTLLRLMLDHEPGLRAAADRLRVVTVGGEPLFSDLARRFAAALPRTTLLNDYGCTEVNTILHAASTPGSVDNNFLKGSRPIANLRVHLLDEGRRPVPVGDPGELCVAGPGVAAGYLDRDDETAARFVEFPPGSSETVYRTGDVARLSSEGDLLLLGRADNQVKVSGMRIELEGVEAMLAEHAAVRESAVVTRDLSNGARQLHAFVVAERGAHVEVDELRRFLADRLPPSAVPVGYQLLDALPRSDRGKLDRRALPTLAPRTREPATADGASPLSRAEVADGMRELLARDVLEVDPRTIDAQRDFHLLGVDSVLAVEFTRRLQDRYEVDLGVASIYDCPNLDRLSAHLWELLAKGDGPRAVRAAAAPDATAQNASWPRSDLDRHPTGHDASPRADRADIAVVGMSGRFPLAADVEELWQVVVHGRDATAVVPRERWDAEALYDADPDAVNRSTSKWGAMLDNIAAFEPLFFGIAPSEAALMDPQQRLCLEEAWKALEHAGHSPEQLDGQRVGVFVGAKKGDYAGAIPRDGSAAHGDVLLGNDAALIASRVAYHLDLHGPCLTVDTACSSSLTALHLACRSLEDGECDLALVGGVCVVTDKHFYVSTSRLGIFSPTGHTRPFDADADGFVQGEGVVFVVVRRLDDAARDTVHGVIVGTAINQDGRTNGIGAPSATAQRSLQVDLYRRRGIDPASIGYVEAHGTATKVGDPIEVAALTSAFREFTPETGFCALGSLKGNIGHLTAAAGLASLVKVLLCLRHRTLPPVANFSRLNEHLDLADSPFYVPASAREWTQPAAGPRTAAISSFGLGGTNAHCVVCAPPAHAADPVARRPAYLVVVSARTEESLGRRLHDLLDCLSASDTAHELRDVAFTLLAGRRLFAPRRVFVASDVADLREQLRDAVGRDDAGVAPGGPLTAIDQEFGEFLTATLGDPERSATQRAKLDALAELVARGFDVPATPLFRGERPQRIPLPTYPFIAEHHWHDASPAVIASSPTRPSRVEPPEAPPDKVAPSGADRVAKAEVDVAFREPRERRPDEALTETVLDAVSRLLGVRIGELDKRMALADYGLDSIKAITLKRDLERHLRTIVPMELVGMSASIDELLARLAEHVAGDTPGLALEAATDDELDRLFASMADRMPGALR